MDRKQLAVIARNAINKRISISQTSEQSPGVWIASGRICDTGVPIALKFEYSEKQWHVISMPIFELPLGFAEPGKGINRDTVDIYAARLAAETGPSIESWVSIIMETLESPRIKSLEELREFLDGDAWDELPGEAFLDGLLEAMDAAALAGYYEAQEGMGLL